MATCAILLAVSVAWALAAPSLYEYACILARISITNVCRSANPEFRCPENYNGVRQAQIVQRAVEVARYIGLIAHDAAGRTPSPAYSLIFKTLEFENDILKRYSRAATLPALPSGPLSFVCVNFQQVAWDPRIWETCQEPEPAFMRPETSVVFICPSFFDIAGEDMRPHPAQCPSVRDNVFVKEEEGWVPDTRGFILFNIVLCAYGTDLDRSEEIKLNDLPRFNAARAAMNVCSYMTFASCMFVSIGPFTLSLTVSVLTIYAGIVVKNQCNVFPDLTKPPWYSFPVANETHNVHPLILSLNDDDVGMQPAIGSS